MNFPFTAESFGNLEIAIAINLLIYSLLLLVVPSIFILVVSLIKPKIKEKSSFYLYAFSSAVFIMIGTLGLLKESFDDTASFVETNHYEPVASQFITIGIIAGGAILGLTIAILFRFVFLKRVGEVHSMHDHHSHSDHIVNVNDIDHPRAAWLVIFLILSHRTIDGFVLGGSVAKITEGDPNAINLGLIITFNLHILIEVLIIYYRQVQFGQTRKKAFLYNFYTLLAIIPIMFIGAYVNKYLDLLGGWILPLANASGGTIITFVAIIDLVPEFLHNKKMIAKEWYKLIIIFGLGIVFALILLSFHTHEHTTEETHVHSLNFKTYYQNLIDSYKVNSYSVLNSLKC